MESLFIKICLNNKLLVIHNIYRVEDVLDVTLTLAVEPGTIMAGNFNSRDEMWYRGHTIAGRVLVKTAKKVGYNFLDQ